MANDQYILKHYKNIARVYGESKFSSIQDPIIRDSEIHFISKQIEYITKEQKVEAIADLGCGNGHLLSLLSTKYPTLQFYGHEFTPELYEIAQNRNIKNCKFYNSDIRESDLGEASVDIIITERVLINLLSWKQQCKAIHNIIRTLRPSGHYIMVESFAEPLRQLNQARVENMQSIIEPSKHNRFLKEGLVEYLERVGLTEVEGVYPKNFLSTHFFNSRVLQPAFQPEGSKRKFSHMVNFLFEAMPPAIGNYSPILFRVFKRV